MSSSIRCPKCHSEIPLSEALSSQVDSELREKEASLRRQLTDELRESLERQLRQSISQDQAVELQDLRNQLQERVLKESRIQQEELALRKRLRELEQSKRDFELELERKLDERLTVAQEESAQKFAEDHSRALAEKDAKLLDMHQKLMELERRASQNSQQLQGEVAQQKLEERLKLEFPVDDIEAVGKGRNGADIVQSIRADRSGTTTGAKILWESKETKDFSSDWIAKLKRDQGEVKADIAVLVTTALPKGERRPFYFEEGVWIVRPQSAIDLGIALRMGLLEASNVRRLMEQEGGSKEDVFRYFTGNEFRLRILSILDSIQNLKANLDDERKSLERVWSEREKKLTQLMKGTVGIVGDIQGIDGRTLVSFPELELTTLAAPDGKAKAKK